MNSPFSIKLFLGYPLTPDLKHHLHGSHDWHQAKLSWQGEAPGLGLVEVYHQGKHYLGQYIEKEQLTLCDLKTLENKIFDILERHKPGLNRDNMGCSIFPQLFIG